MLGTVTGESKPVCAKHVSILNPRITYICYFNLIFIKSSPFNKKQSPAAFT